MIGSVCLLAASLVFSPAEAKVAYNVAADLVENCTPRDAGTFGSSRAAYRLLDAISSTGADATLDRFKVMTPRGEKTMINIESAFVASDDAEWIVFLSHYDTKMGVACPGADDGASTSGLLVALAELLYKERPSNCNILLAWLDGEESMVAYGKDDGLWGSRHLAEKLKDRRAKVRAVFCLDMLGGKDLVVAVPKNGNAALRRVVQKVARHLGKEDRVKLVGDSITDDHVPFHEAGFRAVDIIGMCSARPLPYWHTPEDTMKNISEESLLFAGELAVALLNGLTPETAETAEASPTK